MLTWIIFENVYNCLANNGDFIKLSAIMLMQTRLNFQKVLYSLGNNNSFCKNDENTLRFKRNWWESLDEKHEKGVTTTKDYAGNLIVLLAFYRYFL